MKLKAFLMAVTLGLSACNSPVITVKCNNSGGIDTFFCSTTGAIVDSDEQRCADALAHAKNMCDQSEQVKVTMIKGSPAPVASPSTSTINACPLVSKQ